MSMHMFYLRRIWVRFRRHRFRCQQHPEYLVESIWKSLEDGRHNNSGADFKNLREPHSIPFSTSSSEKKKNSKNDRWIISLGLEVRRKRAAQAFLTKTTTLTPKTRHLPDRERDQEIKRCHSKSIRVRDNTTSLACLKSTAPWDTTRISRFQRLLTSQTIRQMVCNNFDRNSARTTTTSSTKKKSV